MTVFQFEGQELNFRDFAEIYSTYLKVHFI